MRHCLQRSVGDDARQRGIGTAPNVEIRCVCALVLTRSGGGQRRLADTAITINKKVTTWRVECLVNLTKLVGTSTQMFDRLDSL